MVVLLPAPFGPRKPKISPSRTAMSSDSSAVTGGVGLTNGTRGRQPAMAVVFRQPGGRHRIHRASVARELGEGGGRELSLERLAHR
jgi:hypothetical protein